MNDNNSSSERIAQLERRVRGIYALMLVIPTLTFLLGAAATQSITAKSVTTGKLIIVDADGKERAAIYTDSKDNDPVLEMYNQDHSLILNAGKSQDNGVGFIQFFDKSGKFKTGFGGNAVK